MKWFGFKTGLFILALMLAGGLSAHAEDTETKRAWYIPELVNIGAGFHGGYQKSQDADGGVGFAGAHLRFRVLSFLGIEVAGDATEETFRDKSIDISETPLSLTGLIYPFGAPFTVFPWPVTPYFSGGATWVFFKTDFRRDLVALQAASDVAHDTAQGWHTGAGFDIGLSRNVTFNVEYRATFWDFRENIDNAAVRAALPDLSTNNYTVRGGLTFLFK